MEKRKTIASIGMLLALGLATVAFGAEQLPEVVVTAGPVNRTVVGRSPTTNAPIERVAVDYRVSYADLDLVKHADVQTLHSRIESAARDACMQLDELFPLEKPQFRTCMQDAIQGTANQVQSVIAEAASRHKAG